MQFPIEFSTDILEGAVPHLTKYFGYDKHMSMRIKNLGAPRIIYNEKYMKILFSLEIDFFDVSFIEKIMTIQFHDVILDTKMWLEDFTLQFLWNKIEIGSATLISEKFTEEEK